MGPGALLLLCCGQSLGSSMPEAPFLLPCPAHLATLGANPASWAAVDHFAGALFVMGNFSGHIREAIRGQKVSSQLLHLT